MTVISDDDALTAAACGGDHAAYTALYRRHAGRVYARLGRLVGPTCDREDLLQQVFLQLYRALPRFRADSSIATFIQGIAVHVALDYRRRRLRRPQDFTAYQLDELIDRGPTTLVAIAGLSLEEAAGLVDANADTVKQRIQRARRELLAMVERAERAERTGGRPA